MTSVEDENHQLDIEEINLENLEENNMNQQNNSEIKKEIGDLKDNIKSKNDNENKEKLSNKVIEEKNKENKTDNEKDEEEEDNKIENKEIKNKSEINSSQVISGNQSYDNNNNNIKSNTELKDEDGDDAEKNNKNKNENIDKDILSPSYSNISYRPSEYRSILQNTELTESDKLLIEKYSNYKNNKTNVNNNDLCDYLGFTKKLAHNYQTLEEPKSINYLSKYKYNSIEATPKQYLKNNLLGKTKSLLENENEKPKTYLERKNLVINDIGKDVNFSWDNPNDKDDKKIEKKNLEKIIFNNSQIEKDITNSYKSNKNDDNQDFIKNIKEDYSNKRNLNKEDKGFNLNINYWYNIPKNFDKTMNLLNKTSLANYHIPHTQSSIIKKYIPNYSIFDFHRYNNYKSTNSSSISSINKYNNDIQNIANKSNQNMNNDSQYNNNNNNNKYNVNVNNNNYKSILNYENKNRNNKNTSSMINNSYKNLDNTNNINKENQSIKSNEKPFINNSKSIPSNSLFIQKNNSKKYKSLLYDAEKKSDKNIEKSFNNNSIFNKNDIQNNLGQYYYKDKSVLLQPYQYYPFQTIMQDNINQSLNQNEDLIIRHRKGGAFRDNIKKVIINSSPSDFYYNTLHQEFIPKTRNIGKRNKPQFSKVYQIDKNKDSKDIDRDKDMNNKKHLFYFSTIRRDLINKNKSKSFKAL